MATTKTDSLLRWMRMRESIRVKKEAGRPKPWTDDSVMQRYSFCNVRREDDRVTRWIANNWRTPGMQKALPDLWFWMVIARYVNWPDSLAAMKPPGRTWQPEDFLEPLLARRARKEKVFSGAYMITPHKHRLDTAVYLCDHVMVPLWNARRKVRPRVGDTLQSFFERLHAQHGMGQFMAAQVVADMKYVPPLDTAADWMSWAVSGAGSRRGLNRVLGRDKTTPWLEDNWLTALTRLRMELRSKARGSVRELVEGLHAQDLQNCLCEFDKYERTRLGEGRPRATYNGRE